MLKFAKKELFPNVTDILISNHTKGYQNIAWLKKIDKFLINDKIVMYDVAISKESCSF